jgi:MoaA/NifB/PqqE/SkfB family radical SAM enzyme
MRRTVSFSKNEANVFFHILTQCNLHCRHCYINPAQHGSERLPIETIRHWLKILAHRSPGANLIFLGGEPTLHPDLPAAISAARELQYASVTIDTNGYVFNHILDRTSPILVDFFSFSLDGATAQVNDAIRGKGSYEACIAGITAAKTKGFKTSLIYTVSSRNLHQLADMPVLLEKFGIDRFFIQVIGLRGQSAVGRDGESDPLQVSREQWLQHIPAVAEQAARRGIPTTYPKVYLDFTEDFECAGLVADNYFIFPNGRVYRCPLCEDFALHSLSFIEGRLVSNPPINESDLFQLGIAEGCVMNKLVQPQNLSYSAEGEPLYQIACCMLKEHVSC